MKIVSNLAIAVSLLAAGSIAAPVAAQSAKASATAATTPPQRTIKLSKGAAKAIMELDAAVKAKSPDVPQKLAAAQKVAKTSDDKYYIAKLQLAAAGDDKAAIRIAAEAILASGGADAAETASLRSYLAGQALASANPADAERILSERVAANPADIDSLVSLAQIKKDLKKDAEALNLLQKAISAAKSAGKTVPEPWYKAAVSLAYGVRNDTVASQLAQEALSAYPSKENFNNLLAVSAKGISKDEQAYVDLLRLMQVSGTMQDAADYLRLAEHFEYEKNWGEAKSVLEAAARAGKTSARHTALLSRVSGRIAEDKAALASAEPKARSAANGALAQSLASVYAGYGNHAKAIELYRLALQKGGVDANLINTRLGIVHVSAGQRAEAEAAFKAVTGLRAPLAGLWLNWLAQRG